ncbi:dihydrolipoamide acetyltransferase family protein [Kitasatospora sp. NPDC057015]|uniref:dihydrolipoamide acetyltransferase family protein n=1 Tax=Kitasatospora sp. NPDC057015 TaxID=3346001 RepID=UPI00363DEEA6
MPDVGEGLDEAEILKWYVRPGDRVHDGMPVCEVETAKSVVELPVPYDGVVHELRFGEGVTVAVGAVIITVDTAPDTAELPAPAGPSDLPARQPAAPSAQAQAAAEEPREALLVGYGVMNGSSRRRPRRQPPTATAGGAGAGSDGAGPTGAGGAEAPVLAKPPVRRLARDLGVDLGLLVPTGPGGVVTREDVHAAARPFPPPVAAGPVGSVGSAAGARPAPVAQDADPAGPQAVPGERRVPVKGVRRATAAAVTASAFTAPHVTEFVDVDVTRTMKLVRRLRQDEEFEGLRVTPLLLVAKALLTAVRRYPEINARWDEAQQEIVVKDVVNLGIAAATPRGLIVPNIKRAGSRTLPELARELQALTETARAGRTTPADQAGGTVTITNIGVFGVDTGTPILNPGEAAILAVGAIRERPWIHRGEVRARQVTTLALSFDHRLVDGELGSRVLATVAAVLERPRRLISWS